jgi:transcriptional regulator with PAS, ATPase and Fis domain
MPISHSDMVLPKTTGNSIPMQLNPDPFDAILGDSTQARAIRRFGRRAATVDAAVLITGETGTGKGVLAHAIHQASTRCRGPFVSINCAGVPESLFESEFFGHVRGAFTGALQSHRGLLEQAHQGTLFLDEVGELPLALQPKLLTALEEGRFRRVGAERLVNVDIRVIAATSVDLLDAVARHRFRSDLYHRLRVLTHALPPLRARGDDVISLARVFVDYFGQRYRRPVEVDPASFDALQQYDWPGNIRELAHAIESALVSTDASLLSAEAFLPPPEQRFRGQQLQLHPGRYSFKGSAVEERELIRRILDDCHGNKSRAARSLGMSRNTLMDKLRRFELFN